MSNTRNDSNENVPEVIVKKESRFSPIWIIPLVALGIGGWLLFQVLTQMGIPITIMFKDGTDLVAGKTYIKFNGINVGIVKSLDLSKDLKGVIVKANLNRSASHIAREGSSFWIVKPEIGPKGITGLDTIFSGQYIAVIPGHGKPEKIFTGIESPPDITQNEKGLHLLLKADRLGSLHAGAPVYYREIKVGEVERTELAQDSMHVNVYIFVDDTYSALVHQNTKFWNASGIGLNVGLFGAKMKTESLKAILTGGIAFATPNNQHMGPANENGDEFKLFEKPEDLWLKWKPEISLKK